MYFGSQKIYSKRVAKVYNTYTVAKLYLIVLE